MGKNRETNDTSKTQIGNHSRIPSIGILFAFIIYLIHEEREKKSSMECKEMHWLEEQQLTDRTFIKMLNLATTGELIAGRTEEDYTAYQNKCMEVISLLQKVKDESRRYGATSLY